MIYSFQQEPARPASKYSYSQAICKIIRSISVSARELVKKKHTELSLILQDDPHYYEIEKIRDKVKYHSHNECQYG